MALQKPYNLENTDLSFPDAYHVIRRIEVSKNNSEYISNIYVIIYSSEDARRSNKLPIVENSISLMGFIFNYDLTESDNLITQAYNYLKTTENYSDSIDV